MAAALIGLRAEEGRWITLPVFAVVLLSMWLFASLTVEVTDTEVRLAFGPGLVRKRFAVSEIVAARTVSNPWYYGWGIRLTPHGWLYNVSGRDAVEVEMRTKRKVRIGTDEPSRLVAALRQAVPTLTS